MIVPLRNFLPVSMAFDIPQRRRVIVIGATEAGVSAAFHLGKASMLIEQRDDELPHSLGEFMPGELKLGERVVAIHSNERCLRLASGESFIYDRLVSSLGVPAILKLTVDETPARVRGGEWWSYWLECRGIEMIDAVAQLEHGDVTGETAGKRVADRVRRDMALKYAYKPASGIGTALFQPRLVSG